MNIGELIKLLEEHHYSKEVFGIVGADAEPYELTSVVDEHDSIYLVL